MIEETRIEWFAPYDRVLDTSRGVEWAQWFTGGKINIALELPGPVFDIRRSRLFCCEAEDQHSALASRLPSFTRT